MSAETAVADFQRELERLKAQVGELQVVKDRLEILDCVMNHARSHDRHDTELKVSVYHEDGVDEHGGKIESGPGSAAWANAAHAAAFSQHAHHITTHTCEIDGNVAHCESYVLGAFLSKDLAKASLVSGRYVDRLERRHGRWAIVVRRNVIEVIIETEPANLLEWGSAAQFLKGVFGHDDISYLRPLDATSGERWS